MTMMYKYKGIQMSSKAYVSSWSWESFHVYLKMWKVKLRDTKHVIHFLILMMIAQNN